MDSIGIYICIGKNCMFFFLFPQQFHHFLNGCSNLCYIMYLRVPVCVCVCLFNLGLEEYILSKMFVKFVNKLLLPLLYVALLVHQVYTKMEYD